LAAVPLVPESRSFERYLGCACWRSAAAAWNLIGGFDKELLVYGEETDWQARAHTCGGDVLWVDELGVDHGSPVTGKGSDGAGHGTRRKYRRLRTRATNLLRANTAECTTGMSISLGTTSNLVRQGMV
jgi:GT2 family glycosyltransferase